MDTKDDRLLCFGTLSNMLESREYYNTKNQHDPGKMLFAFVGGFSFDMETSWVSRSGQVNPIDIYSNIVLISIKNLKICPEVLMDK